MKYIYMSLAISLQKPSQKNGAITEVTSNVYLFHIIFRLPYSKRKKRKPYWITLLSVCLSRPLTDRQTIIDVNVTVNLMVVGSILERLKFYNFWLFSFLRFEVELRHSTGNASKNSAESGERSVLTLGFLCLRRVGNVYGIQCEAAYSGLPYIKEQKNQPFKVNTIKKDTCLIFVGCIRTKNSKRVLKNWYF